MNRYFIAFAFVFGSHKTFAQPDCYSLSDFFKIHEKIDTVVIPYWVIEHGSKHLSFREDQGYFDSGSPIDSAKWMMLEQRFIQANKMIYDAAWHYCFILNPNGSVSKEGRIGSAYYFIGPVRFYDTNGALESTGCFSDNSCLMGVKTGKWKYYNHRAKVIRVEEYDHFGKLLKQNIR